MTLEQFILPQSPIEPFLKSVSATLDSIVDQSTPTAKKLFQSVAFGVDTVFKSAIDGQPSAQECPMVRIFFDPNRLRFQNQQNLPLFVILPVELVIVFSMDFPITTSFQLGRERFCRYVLDWLKYPVFSDNRGLQHDSTWKWITDEAPISHDITTIRSIGRPIQITPASDYSATSISLQAMIKNYTN